MAEEKMAGLSLVQKIAKVQSGIGKIKKEGHNTAQNYDFVTEAQVKEIIRLPLAKLGVIFNPQFETIKEWTEPTRKGGTMHYASVLGKFELTDGITTIFGSMPGTGMDSGDKAVFKAETGAQKNYLMQLFMISTGDDPEREELPQNSNSYHNSNNNSNSNKRNYNNYSRSKNQQYSNNRQAKKQTGNVGNGKINDGMLNTIKNKVIEAAFAWQMRDSAVYELLEKKYDFKDIRNVTTRTAQEILLYLNGFIKSASQDTVKSKNTGN